MKCSPRHFKVSEPPTSLYLNFQNAPPLEKSWLRVCHATRNLLTRLAKSRYEVKGNLSRSLYPIYLLRLSIATEQKENLCRPVQNIQNNMWQLLAWKHSGGCFCQFCIFYVQKSVITHNRKHPDYSVTGLFFIPKQQNKIDYKFQKTDLNAVCFGLRWHRFAESCLRGNWKFW